MNSSRTAQIHSNRSTGDYGQRLSTSIARTACATATNETGFPQKTLDEKSMDNTVKTRPFLDYIAQQRLETRMNASFTHCVDGFLKQFESTWLEIKSSIRSDFQNCDEITQTANETNMSFSDLESQYTRIAERVSELTASFSVNLADEVKQMLALKGGKKPTEVACSSAPAVSQRDHSNRLREEAEEEDYVFKNSINELFEAVANEPADLLEESNNFNQENSAVMQSSRSSFGVLSENNVAALPKPGAKLLKEFPSIQNPRIQSVLAQLKDLKLDEDDTKSSASKQGEKIKVYPPMVLENGDVYEGAWLLSTKHGFGKILSFSGFYYEGEWKNDLAHGKGRLININGDVYEGGWINGKYHGYGIFKGSNGYSYHGEWSHDMQHGLGREDWADGSYYEGEYKWSKKHGKGNFKWANGESYTGQFCLNNLHGQGVYAWPDGKNFSGIWRENKIVADSSFESPKSKKDNEKLEIIEEEDLKVVLTSPNCVMVQKEGLLQERKTSSFSLHSKHSAEQSSLLDA